MCKSFISDGEVNNVIKNLNLEIYEGDFTVIMGSSGSGKSTLLYSISGMDEITTGKVFFDGLPANDSWDNHKFHHPVSSHPVLRSSGLKTLKGNQCLRESNHSR